MQIKPEDIDRRFRKAYEASYMEAIEDTKSIIEEIVHLAERQFPQIDTALIYRRLAYTRAIQNSKTYLDFPEESPEWTAAQQRV